MTVSDPAGSSVFAYTNFGAFQGALASEDGPWASDTVTHTYVGRLATGLTLAQPPRELEPGVFVRQPAALERAEFAGGLRESIWPIYFPRSRM